MPKKILILLLLFMLLSLSGCKCHHKDKNGDGLCDKCEQEVSHKYQDGICIHCGQADPSYVPPIQSIRIDAEYNLTSASFDNEDVTNDFILYQVIFRSDLTMTVKIYHNGYLETRNSTYFYSGSLITETYQDQKYQYTLFNNQLLTTYIDLGDQIEIILKLNEDENMDKAVSFESVLFGENLLATKKYNYCPAIIYDTEDGKTIMHVWYCMNRDSGVIMDYIGYRKGVLQDDGKWLFSDEEIAVAPTPNTWDARHTCDPSVVKGEFSLNGEEYNYLMAYLGCTTEDYQKNETGIAVSKTPGGPWVKVDNVNPIIPWYDDGVEVEEEAIYQSYKGTSRIYWGTGMPSLVSIDHKGEILMFYQSTHRGVGIRRIDLSDLDNPVVKFTTTLSSKKIVNSAGQNCNIGIPDFAYDPVTKRFYVTSVTNERNPADVTLTRVNSHSFVAYLENINSMEDLCSILQSGSYEWKIVGYIGPQETGWERNHNPGIVKNEFGEIPDATKIQVIVSTGHNSWATENIFTYRLFGWTFLLE